MKAFTIFKAVTKNWMRSRTGLFFSILFPILLLVVFGFIFSGVGGTSQFSIFVQNQDLNANDGKPSELSTAFVSALNSSEAFSIREIPADANVTEYARDALGPLGGSMRILVIAEGVAADLVNGTKTSLTIMLDPTDQSGTAVKSIIASVANAFNYQLIGAESVIEFKETSVVTTQFSTVEFIVPGITAAFIMTNGIIGLTANTTEFKRRGIIKRLSITPLTKLDWIVGNVLSQTLLNLMLTAIMLGLGWAF
jgi:ABC-2 type transport system permease protein